jgi:hypothetical protein
MLLESSTISSSPVFIWCASDDVAERGHPNADRAEATAPSRERELMKERLFHLVAMCIA